MTAMRDYLRKVHYHETDKMGITHHANYIKWMEEARVDYLDQLGYSYARLEREGLSSPVVSVECRYLHATTFDDEMRIRVGVEAMCGVTLVFRYTMTNARTGEPVLTGRSKHCFVDESGRPIILKKRCPEFDRALRAQIEEDAETEVILRKDSTIS